MHTDTFTEHVAAEIYARIVAERYLGRSEERAPKPKELARIALLCLEAATAFASASTEYQSAAGPGKA